MRDHEVYRMAKGLQDQTALIYRQVQFLNTRLSAIEAVLESRIGLLKALFSSTWLKNTVDNVQKALLKQHDDEMRALAEKKKEEAQKPKITLLNGV